jgi:uncharacterized protein
MSSETRPDELFECRMCGDCCRGYGGTYVSASDIQAIAAYLQIDPSDFKDQYCRRSGSRYVIAQADNGYCIFWDQLCRIHPVKPRMCRNWPFIAAVLKDVANWRIMGASCPGIRTDLSDAVTSRTVARLIKARREARCTPPPCEKPENE